MAIEFPLRIEVIVIEQFCAFVIPTLLQWIEVWRVSQHVFRTTSGCFVRHFLSTLDLLTGRLFRYIHSVFPLCFPDSFSMNLMSDSDFAVVVFILNTYPSTVLTAQKQLMRFSYMCCDVLSVRRFASFQP